jgi:anti-sigma B factor antagonist
MAGSGTIRSLDSRQGLSHLDDCRERLARRIVTAANRTGAIAANPPIEGFRRKRRKPAWQSKTGEPHMSLKITTREAKGVRVLDLSGRLTIGEASASFREEIGKALEKGDLKILLNLGDVTYIDSAGLGELISAYTSVSNRSGKLKLLSLTKRVHDLMQITKLYTVFEVFDDETSALASFG